MTESAGKINRIITFRLSACLGLRLEFAEEVTRLIIFQKRIPKNL